MLSFRVYSTTCILAAGKCLGLVLLSWAFVPVLGAQSLEEARLLYRAGDLRASLEAFRAIAEGAGEDLAAAASARTNACLILGNLSELEEALPECREALRLRRLQDDPPRLARIFNNLALVEEQLGLYDEAQEHYREALGINRTLGDLEAECINLINLGVLASQQDRHPEALRYFAAARALAEAHAEEPWTTEQGRLARINQGVELERLGAYGQALELFREARRMVGEDRGRDATLAVNIGVAYRNLGDPVRAAAAFEEAAAVFRELEDVTSQANALLNLGLARHLNLRQSEAAEVDFRRALGLLEDSGDRAETMRAHYYLGRLLLDTGNLNEAREELERCRQVAEEIHSPEGRWSAYEGLGRAAAASGEPERAMDFLLLSLTEIERVREGLGTENGLRAGYFGERRPVYEAAVRILAEQAERQPAAGHAARALELVQRAKARELLDRLGAAAPGAAAPLPAQTLLETVGNGTLLEYFVAEGRLLCWRLHAGELQLFDLGSSQEVFAQVRQVHTALAHGRQPSAELAAQLSQALLRPLLGMGNGKRLFIAPDRMLHYLPFEILPAAEKAEELLIQRHTVAYLPSASTLAWVREDEGELEHAWIGFGAPEPRPAKPDALRELMLARIGLRPLPRAAAELRMVEERLGGPGVLRLGAAATESAFEEAIVGGARVTHLATHTVVDEELGQGAAILLASSGEQDGLLFPNEIARLRAPCQLTVLAACSTTLGLEEDSKAMASLTGAFLAAGSRAVLATLWEVEDAAAAAFMEQLYFQLERGLAPAEALAATKRRFLADPRWRRPDLWAAFILVGDTGSIRPKRVPAPLWLLAVLASLACVLLARRGR